MTEFREVFASEPEQALRWAFRTWREQSKFFPAISEIRELLQEWHDERTLAAAERKHREERRAEEAARASGQLVSFPEIAKQLAEIAKMPEAAPAQTRTVTPRKVPPALQLTREQIEKRRDAERAEIERVQRQMEGA